MFVQFRKIALPLDPKLQFGIEASEKNVHAGDCTTLAHKMNSKTYLNPSGHGNGFINRIECSNLGHGRHPGRYGRVAFSSMEAARGQPPLAVFARRLPCHLRPAQSRNPASTLR